MEQICEVKLVFKRDKKTLRIREHSQNAPMLTMGLPEEDLFNLGCAIFEIERELMTTKKATRKVEKLVSCTISHHTDLSDTRKKAIEDALNTLFLFLYQRNVTFSLTHKKCEQESATPATTPESTDAVLLFSGGLDSILGLNYCKAKFSKTLAVYVRHSTASQLTPKINQLDKDVLTPQGISLQRVAAPAQMTGYFANTRGILYIISGAIYAHKNSCPLIVSECGVTMYQARFGPLYKTTYTTHPLIVQTAQTLIENLLGTTIEIQFPFENSTKAEMTAQWMRGNEQAVGQSFSCLKHLRFVKSRGNCGHCYACLVRRLGLIIAGDPTKYHSTQFTSPDIKQELLPVLDFSARILQKSDQLEYWEREKIDKYGKEDLFVRFALDNMVALKMLSKSQKLDPLLSDLLQAVPAGKLAERQLALAKLKTDNS